MPLPATSELQAERQLRDALILMSNENVQPTHHITISFDLSKNIKYARTEPQLRFVKFIHDEIECLCFDKSRRQLKNQPPSESMKMTCVPEDFRKRTNQPVNRHFHIHLHAPKLSDPEIQHQLKQRADQVSKRLFDLEISNFDIQEAPTSTAEKIERISYDFKNSSRLNAFDEITTQFDYRPDFKSRRNRSSRLHRKSSIDTSAIIV